MVDFESLGGKAGSAPGRDGEMFAVGEATTLPASGDIDKNPSDEQNTHLGHDNSAPDIPSSATWSIPKAKKRKSKTKPEREAAKGRRPGAKDRFQGLQFKFLESRLEAYGAIQVTQGGRKAQEETAEFWETTTSQFWQQFSWEECRKDIGEKAANWDESKVVESTNKLVKSNKENPWKSLLSALRAPQGRAPKQLPAWQVWMSDNLDIVNAHCDERKAKGLTAHIGDRNAIARAYFETLSRESHQEYETKAKERFEEETASFAASQSGEPSEDPEAQAEARSRLAVVVTPLLKLLCEYTGFKAITLIGGLVVEDGRCMVGAVDYGKTVEPVPRSFSAFDPEGFDRKVIDQYTKFLYATRGVERPDGAAPAQILDVGTVPGELQDVSELASETRASGSGSRRTEQSGQRGTSASTAGKNTESTSQSTFTPSTEKSSEGRSKPKPKPKGRAQPARTAASDPSTRLEEEVLILTERAGADLRQSVYGLPEKQRRARIRELNATDDWELDRQNNIARLRQALAAVGPKPWEDAALQAPVAHASTATVNTARTANAITAVHGDVLNDALSIPTTSRLDAEQRASPVAHADPDTSDPPAPHSASRYNTHSYRSESTPIDSIVMDTSSDSLAHLLPDGTDDGGDGDGDGDDGDSGSERGRVSLVPDHEDSSNGVDRASWPEWLKEHYGVFETVAVGDDHSREWSALLREWALLEADLEFKGPRVGFEPKSRPAEVSLWIKNARTGPVIVTNAEKYAKQFKTWWNKINPAWRIREGEFLSRGGSGDWSSMAIGSTNGFLNIIAGLIALREATGVEDWGMMMRDILWVLQEVRKQRSSASQHNTRSPRSPQGEPPAKRARHV
ncbi:hypothetical protein EIP86_000965 [Pleurotus ostreatoroseus]|nr:hypothetical protein EIP86_000965 [Pleurotus ostreatoroseus]